MKTTAIAKTSRKLLLALCLTAGLTAGCAGPQISEYALEKPTLDMRQYFNGTVDAYGVFTDRAGKVVKRFTVVMKCSWQENRFLLKMNSGRNHEQEFGP